MLLLKSTLSTFFVISYFMSEFREFILDILCTNLTVDQKIKYSYIKENISNT